MNIKWRKFAAWCRYKSEAMITSSIIYLYNLIQHAFHVAERTQIPFFDDDRRENCAEISILQCLSMSYIGAEVRRKIGSQFKKNKRNRTCSKYTKKV